MSLSWVLDKMGLSGRSIGCSNPLWTDKPAMLSELINPNLEVVLYSAEKAMHTGGSRGMIGCQKLPTITIEDGNGLTTTFRISGNSKVWSKDL